MKIIKGWKALILVGLLTVIALPLNLKFGGVHQHPAELLGMTDFVPAPRSQAARPQLAPPKTKSIQEELTEAARQVVAVELANRDVQSFDKQLRLVCLSVSHSRKSFSGYGISSDVVVVTVLFQLSIPPNGSSVGLKSIRNFDVSETIEAERFHGLDDPEIIRLIVASLKEQLLANETVLSTLQNLPNP